SFKRHAIWVLKDADPETGAWVSYFLAMKDKDAGVRLQAVRVMGHWPDMFPTDLMLLAVVREDPDPQVRLYAINSLIHLKRRRNIFFLENTNWLKLMAKEQDRWVRFALVQFLKQGHNWEDLGQKLIADKLQRVDEGLILALAEEYNLDALNILERLLDHKTAAIRKQAVETLARIYKERKPYAGSWWGTQPAAQKPPARVVAWEGTPRVREAILGALADKDAGVRKAAVAALIA